VALAALRTARRAAQRLDDLNHAYWELRYEHTQLRARVARLEPDQAAPSGPPATESPTVAFVPLSSLKR
jgi:hypothetical protein